MRSKRRVGPFEAALRLVVSTEMARRGSLRQAAKAVGVSPATLSRWTSGRGRVDVQTVDALLVWLGSRLCRHVITLTWGVE